MSAKITLSEESLEKLADWFIKGDVGNSSEAIVLVGLGLPRIAPGAHPYDPSDLNRCIKLLEAVPELRKVIPLMAQFGPIWKQISDNWDLLESTLRDEKSKAYSRKEGALITYALLKKYRGV